MSVGSPLSYYSAEKSETARPGAITAVAIVGIVLAGLAIFSQMFVAPPTIADPGGRMEMTAFNFGYMFGRLVFIAFLLLMLIGCCGLLSMRSAARLMMIVAAYGWIALAIISILVMVYSSYVYSGNSARTAWIVFLPALMVIAQLGFAVWAMVVVRRPELAAQFGREGNHQVASPLLKGVALLTLIYFGIAALESLVEALGVAFKMPGRDIMLAIRVLPVGNNDADMRLLDLLLATFLHAGFIVGCILVMNGRMAGTRVLIACCLAKMTFTIGLWGMSGDLFSRLITNLGGTTAWSMFHAVIYVIYSRITGLLTPAVLLMVFAYRPVADERRPPPLPR